jgi:hypothetical protein
MFGYAVLHGHVMLLHFSCGSYATSWKVAILRPDQVNVFNLPNLLAALGPGVHSAANRNEYQKQKNNVSGE